MESQERSRRSFLKRMTAFVSGSLLSSKMGFSHDNTSMSVIKNIKPLGFQWETQDPFLFCVHHEDHFPKGNASLGPQDDLSGRHLGQDFLVKDGYRMYHGEKIPGFPGHPHRGFETITVVRKGMVDHSDSLGAAGRYGDGDVQWMTAGKGVQHAEMFPLLNKEAENPLELFQIWLNLPKAKKMVEPHFKMFWGESIPTFNVASKGKPKITVEVLVGALHQHSSPQPPPDSWAAQSKNDVGVFNIHMEANSAYNLPPAADGVNRTLYFYKGSELKVGGENIPFYHAVEVHANQELHLEAGKDASDILVLQGKPINEPVVQHGPFVMNTREEIQQSFQDFQRTGFGGWPWPSKDHVHDSSKGRFALHADGTLEEKR